MKLNTAIDGSRANRLPRLPAYLIVHIGQFVTFWRRPAAYGHSREGFRQGRVVAPYSRVPALCKSFLLGMAIWAVTSYSQEAGPPNVDQLSFGIDPSSSIKSRIGDLPPEIVSRYVDRGVAAPANHNLSTEQRRRISAALEALTPLHQTVLQKHLRSISFVDGIPFKGQTVLINPGSSEAVFDIIINARILNETLSEFAGY